MTAGSNGLIPAHQEAVLSERYEILELIGEWLRVLTPVLATPLTESARSFIRQMVEKHHLSLFHLQSVLCRIDGVLSMSCGEHDLDSELKALERDLSLSGPASAETALAG
jgi:hypothetical protein